MKLNNEERLYLLELARKAIMNYLKNKENLQVNASEVNSKRLTDEGACFVTLNINGQLRGCIGTLEAHQPLVFDVVENAVTAAFMDPRFHAVSSKEIEKIRISISVLTKPVQFKANGPEDLVKKLEPGKHGLILQHGIARATFLPSVWEQLPDKEDFLKHLSMKAGLLPDGWKSPNTKFLIYESEEFSE